MINIFLINWKCIKDIEYLLESLKISSYKDFRIILVNNSKDESMKLNILIKSFSQIFEIHNILSPNNKGYSGGNNLALSYIQKNKLDGDILISNSDILFNELTIKNLVSKLAIKNIGAVSPRIYNSKMEHVLDTIKLNGFLQKYQKTELPICDTDYVPGCCFIIRRELADRIGLFDENFFMYWEEVDLSIRILDNGFKLVCSTESSVIRNDNHDSSYINSIKYSVRNSFLLNRKHKIGLYSHILYLLMMLMLALKKSIKLNNIAPLKSFFLGFNEGRNY